MALAQLWISRCLLIWVHYKIGLFLYTVLFLASWKKFLCDTADPFKPARNNSSLVTLGTNFPAVSCYFKYYIFQGDTEIRQLIQVWEIIFTFKSPLFYSYAEVCLSLRCLNSVHADETYVAVPTVTYLRSFEIVPTHAFWIYDNFKHYLISLAPFHV